MTGGASTRDPRSSRRRSLRCVALTRKQLWHTAFSAKQTPKRRAAGECAYRSSMFVERWFARLPPGSIRFASGWGIVECQSNVVAGIFSRRGGPVQARKLRPPQRLEEPRLRVAGTGPQGHEVPLLGRRAQVGIDHHSWMSEAALAANPRPPRSDPAPTPSFRAAPEKVLIVKRLSRNGGSLGCLQVRSGSPVDGG